MDFLENEEDKRPAQEEVIQPIPSQPFPFLKLPREIRDSIHYYALIRPGTGPYVEPAHICYMHHKASSRYTSTSYWGTEKSTRLFRVNHQFYSETSEIFYSTFQFHFPQTTDVALVNSTLRDTLPPKARRLIRKLSVTILIRGIPGPFTAKDDDKQRLAFEALGELLPNIQRVEISLAVIGHDVPEWQVIEVVNRVLEKLGPLKDMPGLALRGGLNENNQRARILREVREALGCQ